MGLAGPRNRTKISADPNNTSWSKSTDRFGHKILLKQGWTPGAYLGAKDANHAEHYTAANASHIRVSMKDDNLGLGAKQAKAGNETFGLSAFQGLLGRLNGKSEVELKKEEVKHRDLNLASYQNQRWGSIRFVSGGFLVGEKIEKLQEKIKADEAAVKSLPLASESRDEEKSAKKRKRSEAEEEAPKLKRKKRKSDLKAAFEASSQDDSDAPLKKRSKSKKSKDDDAPSDGAAAVSSNDKEDGEKRKLARKEAKRANKFERRLKKEARRLEKEKRRQEKDDSSSDSSSSDAETTPATNDSTPAPQAVKPMSFVGSRLAVRQRYIRQKKMASMDPQALKEIFMIKAEA